MKVNKLNQLFESFVPEIPSLRELSINVYYNTYPDFTGDEIPEPDSEDNFYRKETYRNIFDLALKKLGYYERDSENGWFVSGTFEKTQDKYVILEFKILGGTKEENEYLTFLLKSGERNIKFLKDKFSKSQIELPKTTKPKVDID